MLSPNLIINICYHWKNQCQHFIRTVLSNIGLAEPLRVYTNVNNGTGILGACQRTNIKINLGDYIPKKEDK